MAHKGRPWKRQMSSIVVLIERPNLRATRPKGSPRRYVNYCKRQTNIRALA